MHFSLCVCVCAFDCGTLCSVRPHTADRLRHAVPVKPHTADRIQLLMLNLAKRSLSVELCIVELCTVAQWLSATVPLLILILFRSSDCLATRLNEHCSPSSGRLLMEAYFWSTNRVYPIDVLVYHWYSLRNWGIEQGRALI